MKVQNIEYWKQDLGLIKPYKIAGQYTDKTENAFFRVDLSNGVHGIGSASPSERVCGESMSDTMAALEEASSRLKGCNMRAFHALRSEVRQTMIATPSACAAVDIALFDAFCKSLDISIGDFLGLRIKPLQTSVTIGIKEEHEVKEDLNAYLAEGFRVIKVKVGMDVEHDIETVRKIAEWGGERVQIRVDGNEGYSARDLELFVNGTEKLKMQG